MKRVLVISILIIISGVVDAGLIVFKKPVRFYYIKSVICNVNNQQIDTFDESEKNRFMDIYISDEEVYYYVEWPEMKRITLNFENNDEKGGRIYTRHATFSGGVKYVYQMAIYKDGTMCYQSKSNTGIIIIDYYKKK